MREALVLMILTAACSAALAAPLSAAKKTAVKATLRGRVAELLARYQMWDANERDGKGRSDAKTSGGLGWGENTFLRNYMMCYEVSRDTYWLDKVVDHFDRMIANLGDPDGDGFLAWNDVTYSVGIVRAKPVANAENVTIEPELQRPYVRRGGENVTGHTYEIRFPASDRFAVIDLDSGEAAATDVLYADPTKITTIPGATLTIRGTPGQGTVIRVETTAPEACEYQVHDGMVTYPIALFIEAVHKTPALHERYKKKADEYAALLRRHFFEKWEKTWVDLPNGAGLYKFTDNPTQRFPGGSLPHNQYLALARTWLVLKDVEGLPGRSAYLDRATKMARYFKQNLKQTDGAYVWNYWDPLPDEDIGRNVEDYSHGTIDIGFAIAAKERGVVFDEADLERLAGTYVDVMWDGSTEKPRFGARVDTNKGGKVAWWEWIQLAVADERVWDVGWAVFQDSHETVSMIPSMLHLYDRLVRIDEAERAACREQSARLMALARSTGLFNGGFEERLGERPIGWEFLAWSPDEGGKVEYVNEGRGGGMAVALVGAGGKVNVLIGPSHKFKVKAGQEVRVRAWYRTQGAPGPYFSVVTREARAKRVQYESSGALPLSAEWRQATWSMKAEDGAVEALVYLRNGKAGTVWYDDVEVEIGE